VNNAQVLPQAHFFNFEHLLSDCLAAVSSFRYSLVRSTDTNPIPFIELADKVQVGKVARSELDRSSHMQHAARFTPRGHTFTFAHTCTWYF
jgi:hypothetical protein